MPDSPLQRIKELDKEREQLLSNAKKEALAKAKEAIAELDALGFAYSLTEETQHPGQRLPRGGMRRLKDAPCPVCKFKTNPPHDARKHRGQGKRKRVFTAADRTKLGLAKA
jgi:hypothetical protein